MKAILCHKYSSNISLKYEKIKSPIPKKDEILISVKVAGVNFPDILIVQGKYQFKPELPFSPGGEVSGIIKKVGENVKKFKVGDKVFAGSTWGGFSVEAIVMSSNTFKIPNGISYEDAAASMVNYGTSFHALVDRAKIKKNEVILILGASGGVGTAAIQIAKQLGAIVIAAASSKEKLDYCKEIGADYCINYSKDNIKEKVKSLTKGIGANIIYDPVGDKFSEPALRSIAWKGRFLVVGFAAGQIPKIPLNLVLLKGCQIIGVFWGLFFRKNPSANARNFNTILKWIKNKKLNIHIDKKFLLKDAKKALNYVMNRKVKGKILLIP